MNYERIYNQIIQRAKNRNLDCYSEKHHVVPRCMGGSDHPDNIVRLTAREHFLCHWLLARLYQENYKIVYAFSMMCSCVGIKQERYTPSSRAIEEARILFSKMAGKHLIGGKRPDLAERNRLRRGVYKHSDATKAKLRSLNTGKKQSTEAIQKSSAKRKGKKRSAESVLYLRDLVWITDGVSNMRISKQVELPKGYWKGRTIKSKDI